MDGAAILDAPAGDHEALLEFLYVCPHGLVEFGFDGTVRMINPACSRMLMPLMPPEDRGKLNNVLDLLAPFAPDLRHRIASFGQPSGLVLDGVEIHVGRRADPWSPLLRRPLPSGGDGEAVVLALTLLRLSRDRHMAVLADVSAQVSQRRRLDEVEAWFSAQTDGAGNHACFGLDSRGRVSDWNDGARRLFGLEAEAAIGLDGDLMMSAPGEPMALAPRLAAARREGWQMLEGWMSGPAGGRFWGTTVVSALGMEEVAAAPRAFLAVVRDMTERREAAQALRQALCQDHLTGLLNRRRFFELGEAECQRARHAGHSLTVIMIDADHFKSINDLHGHATGDSVLCALSALLLKLTRNEADLVGRLGGEEFALLLPGQGASAAIAVAERLREALAEQDMTVADRDGAELALRVTASFGVAEHPAGGGGLEALLAAADAALYAAKHAGRNCVRLGQPRTSGQPPSAIGRNASSAATVDFRV